MKPGIYPTIAPDKILNDPKRNPEMQVYEALKRDLGEDFFIYYNCDWYNPSKGASGNRDGEADFIIAHPELGYICIEVKGGEISREANTRKWQRKIRSGFKEVKNPVEQARTSKHVLLSLMRERWKGQMPYMRIKHAVVLPNSGKPQGSLSLGADMPIDIFAFYEDMPALGAKILQIWLGEPEGATPKYQNMGLNGIKIIHNLFQNGFELKVALVSEIDFYDKRIEEMTEDQEVFLQMAAYDANHHPLLAHF